MLTATHCAGFLISVTSAGLVLPANNQRMKKIVFAVIFLCWMSPLLKAQTLQPWKIQLPKGETYSIKLSLKSRIDQQVMGQDMKVVNDVTTVTHFRVVSVTEKGHVVEQSTKGMKMDMEMMGQTVAYDSENKEDETTAIGERMKPLLGATMEAVIGFDGSVTVTRPLDLGDLPSGSMGPAGNDSAMIRNYFLKPPTIALTSGQSWSEVEVNGDNRSSTKFTYLKSEGGFAWFSFESEINTVQTLTNSGMEVLTTMQTKGTGQLKVELSTGIVVERTFDGKLNGKSEVMAMEIPQQGTQQMTTVISRN